MADTRRSQSKNGGIDIARMMPLITILVAIAYAAAAWFLVFVPRIGQVLPGGAYDTGGVAERLAQEKTYLRDLTSATDAVKLINPQQKARVAGIVPSGPDIPGIFVELDALARSNGMLLVAVDTVPADAKDGSGIGRVTVSANIAGGSYRQFLQFLNDVERNLRLLDARSITFTPGSGSYGVTLTAYYLDQKR